MSQSEESSIEGILGFHQVDPVAELAKLQQQLAKDAEEIEEVCDLKLNINKTRAGILKDLQNMVEKSKANQSSGNTFMMMIPDGFDEKTGDALFKKEEIKQIQSA